MESKLDYLHLVHGVSFLKSAATCLGRRTDPYSRTEPYRLLSQHLVFHHLASLLPALHFNMSTSITDSALNNKDESQKEIMRLREKLHEAQHHKELAAEVKRS